MKIVVHFRQAGGVAARDFPVATTWTEDENEIPAPLFSTFDLESVDAIPAEIVTQIEAVIPEGHARLIEAYDVYFDGDFLAEYRRCLAGGRQTLHGPCNGQRHPRQPMGQSRTLATAFNRIFPITQVT